MIQFGFETGQVGNRFMAESKKSLDSIFLRIDCESKVKKSSDKCGVLCTLTIFEHQWDRIFQFSKKNKDEWNAIFSIFKGLLVEPTGDKDHIQQVSSQ